MLPPMIIFKGTTEKTIQKLHVLEGFVIKTSEKLGFENSLLTFHPFLARKIDEIQRKLIEKKTDILMISSGCTSKYQPIDVCINKRFKAILKKCWVEDVSEMINKENVQLPPPSRQDVVDWVEKVQILKGPKGILLQTL